MTGADEVKIFMAPQKPKEIAAVAPNGEKTAQAADALPKEAKPALEITPEQAARYEHEGAEQIGIHGSISGEFIDGARVVYDNLLDEGIKVRHAPGRLAKAVLSLPTT